MNVNLTSPPRSAGPGAAGAMRRARRWPGGILLRSGEGGRNPARSFSPVRLFHTRLSGTIHNFGAHLAHFIRG